MCLLLVLLLSDFFPEFSGLKVEPWRVSPEREDLEDTEDCTETIEDVSGMVLSVVKPPPSTSALADTVEIVLSLS